MKRIARLTAALVLVSTASLHAAKPTTKLSYDPDATPVALFDGLERGIIAAKVVPRNAQLAQVFIKNNDSKPVTVVLPQGIGAVHILKQQDAFDQFSDNAGQNNAGQNNAQAGSGQAVGGGLSPVNGQFPGGNLAPNANSPLGNNNPFGNNTPFNGNGFFSIAPEKTVRIQMRTACLEYGKPEPNVRYTYSLRPVEQMAQRNPTLYQLLIGYDPAKTHPEVFQAACWHLANGRTWKQLAHEQNSRLNKLAGVRFSQRQLDAAKELVKAAQERAKESPEIPFVQLAQGSREE